MREPLDELESVWEGYISDGQHTFQDYLAERGVSVHCSKCKELNRRAQAAESQVAKLTKRLNILTNGVDTWSSPERKREAVERDRMAEVIERHR